MFDFISRWFGKTPRVPTRLTKTQALELARAAVPASERETLTLSTVVQQQRGPVWVVSSATIGSMLEVEIDDATGKVIRIGRSGIR